MIKLALHTNIGKKIIKNLEMKKNLFVTILMNIEHANVR